MTRSKEWEDKLINAVLKGHEDGVSTHTITKETGVHRTSVQKYKRQLGLVKQKNPLAALLRSAQTATSTWKLALENFQSQWVTATEGEKQELIKELRTCAKAMYAFIRKLEKVNT